MANPSKELENAGNDIRQQINHIANTPYPSWLLGTLLLAKGFQSATPSRHAIHANDGSAGGSYKFSQSLAVSKPSRASCFTFGVAQLLGGWIIFDGDTVNGAGFNFAWSSLYLVVNGTQGVKSLFRGRVAPLGLATLALGNAGIYGKKFFWPSSTT